MGFPIFQFASYFFFEFILLLPLVLAMSCQLIEKPSWCLLPMVSFPLDFILVGGANEGSLRLCFFSLKILFVTLFFSIFSIRLYICPPLCFSFTPSMNYMQYFSLMSVTYTGKIISFLLIATLANCIYCSHVILFFQESWWNSLQFACSF